MSGQSRAVEHEAASPPDVNLTSQPPCPFLNGLAKRPSRVPRDLVDTTSASFLRHGFFHIPGWLVPIYAERRNRKCCSKFNHVEGKGWVNGPRCMQLLICLLCVAKSMAFIFAMKVA